MDPEVPRTTSPVAVAWDIQDLSGNNGHVCAGDSSRAQDLGACWQIDQIGQDAIGDIGRNGSPQPAEDFVDI